MHLSGRRRTVAKKDGERKVPKSRIGRLTKLGTLATGLAGDVAGAAGRIVTGSGWDQAAERFHQQAAKRLMESLGRMKGLPMKLGQMLSYIDDFIPAELRTVYRETLRPLQVKVRPMRWAEIEAALTEDLGADAEHLFAHFDREPIAAASIGQVYKAELLDGTAVAVKVQYPGIVKAIQSDLKNVKLLRDVFALVLPQVDVERSLADVTARVLEECDYVSELLNQQQFRRVWEGDPELFIPGVYEELCGHQVLVSEFVEGLSFEEMLKVKGPEERSRLGQALFRFVFRSLYVFGMFHADPHPGNYVFPGDGRLAVLDFGCVQRYDLETRMALSRVRWQAAEGVRGPELYQGMREAYGLPADVDEEELEFLEKYVLLAIEPVLEDRVFRYDREYTERLAALSVKGSMLGARKVVRKGIREAKRPGLVFLNRIQYGLASVLASMGAEANWFQITKGIDQELMELHQKRGASEG
jgi:predicted unusual protein kinase regulating ubiquinone biosynthesis (AarF/ABC1/UbiB family)